MARSAMAARMAASSGTGVLFLSPKSMRISTTGAASLPLSRQPPAKSGYAAQDSAYKM